MNTCHFYKSSQNTVALQSHAVAAATTGQTLSMSGSRDPAVGRVCVRFPDLHVEVLSPKWRYQKVESSLMELGALPKRPQRAALCFPPQENTMRECHLGRATILNYEKQPLPFRSSTSYKMLWEQLRWTKTVIKKKAVARWGTQDEEQVLCRNQSGGRYQRLTGVEQ